MNSCKTDAICEASCLSMAYVSTVIARQVRPVARVRRQHLSWGYALDLLETSLSRSCDISSVGLREPLERDWISPLVIKYKRAIDFQNQLNS
jgi:hypothetical protein